jgi:hypothetical protein
MPDTSGGVALPELTGTFDGVVLPKVSRWRWRT